jgi:putative endonuclease
MESQYYVYILSNFSNRALYVGITNDLIRRISQHRDGAIAGHCVRYHINKLVYYEILDNIECAIAREKQIKAGSRIKKEELVNGFNPEWKDLYDTIIGT